MWDPSKRKGVYVRNGNRNKVVWEGRRDFPEVDAFLDEIEQVCRKHGLSISHEDSHGGFLIEKFDQDNIDWIRDAVAVFSGDLPQDVKKEIEIQEAIWEAKEMADLED